MTVLVGDIGGTNARFAVVEDLMAAPHLLAPQSFRAKDHPSLADAAAHYMARLEGVARPTEAAIAVACPVSGDRIRFTNSDWTFSQTELREKLGLRRLEVLNDFTATAWSLPALRADQLSPLGAAPPPQAPSSGTLAVCGPGTGLGVGGLIRRPARDVVLPSEGGHISFAPLTAQEFAMAEWLTARFGRLSYERLLSGMGLRNLYEAVAHMAGVEPAAHDPAAITRLALADADPQCVETLNAFCAILGSFAGDVALMMCASQLYLAGGIVPRFVDFLRQSEFRARFNAKGRFENAMAAMPVAVILEPHPGLLGAALYLRDRRRSD